MDKSWRGVIFSVISPRHMFCHLSMARVPSWGFRVPWCYAPPPFLSKDFCFLTLMSITRLRQQVIEPWRSVPVRLNRPYNSPICALFLPMRFLRTYFYPRGFFAYAESRIFNLGSEWQRPSNIWVPIGKYRVGHVLSTLVWWLNIQERISSSILCRVS